MSTIAALFVDSAGCYSGLPQVDTWGIERDARLYAGPHPVVAHPPCQRWGRFARAGPGWTCYVEQGHYGHFARKASWLYFVGPRPPELIWTRGEQRLPAAMIERHGYEKARRIGAMAWVGGKDKTRIREATPSGFRDVLLALARSTIQLERQAA